MDRISITVVLLLAAAWMLQILLSTQQIRKFNATSQKLRRLGEYMAVGMAGTTYRKKVYATLVTDEEGRVVAALKLGGWTVFARGKPIDQVIGLSLEEVGRGEPPQGVTAKTWAALDHAADFIRKKITQDAASPLDEEVQ
jgi:DNA-binding transcriptional regulator of glucitol operon